MRQRSLPFVFALLASAGCARETGLFSEQNARAHVEMLAGTIGSRPVGTEANARARAYLVDQLRLYGFDVRVQETDARRPEFGRTARVSNIIAVLPGARREAIGLLAHYDSTPATPGAGDDGLGAAVVVEAGRVLAARQNRQWSLYVLITDAEESGLMGAAALMTDRTVTDRLKAYINIESSGASWPAVLFETGPGNSWIVDAWARRAPHPRGGSRSSEIYRRLPNDTDFSIVKRQDVPGLNFALVGDSYAYHTARDTPDRLSSRTIRFTGENVVSVATALDAMDITVRSPSDAVYFDIGGTAALAYGATLGWFVSFAAVLLGAIASVRLLRGAVVLDGGGRWLLTLVWTVLGAVVVVAAMIATTWALRESREVYHPWYARPDRLLVLLVVTGFVFGWAMTRAGAWLPRRLHGSRHPLVTWSVVLPVWVILAVAVLWLAPAAAYLWTLPLLVAGVLLMALPIRSEGALRVASLVILGASATLWLRDTVDLFRYVVAVFGRVPIITPAYVYAALVTVAGIMLVPPLVAALSSRRPLRRPVVVTILCLLAIAAAAGSAYMAPAYTHDQPLRRYVRALQEPGAPSATWEVGSLEPGLDLDASAPSGWSRTTEPLAATIPWGALDQPFVFRTTGPSLGPAPIQPTAWRLQPLEGGIELSLTVIPQRPGLALAFVLPQGVVPVRSSLPGVVRQGRWTAVYIAPPRDGIAWRASFRDTTAERLREARLAVTDFGFPGGGGWQRLPPWLPQERAVWSATATWAVAPAPALEPVPPLR